jgi:hypothetical protein
MVAGALVVQYMGNTFGLMGTEPEPGGAVLYCGNGFVRREALGSAATE